MSAIVSIVGNSGAGKSTLAEQLAHSLGLDAAREEHGTRPFQSLMASDHSRYACVNQVDYLLLRAEQEFQLRSSGKTGILDGGLEEDFFLFTKLFHQRGYLSDAEYALCERLYHHLRATLPAPDLFIWLDTNVQTCLQRYQARERQLQIARLDDLELLESNLVNWIKESDPKPLLKLDGNESIQALVEEVRNALSLRQIIS